MLLLIVFGSCCGVEACAGKMSLRPAIVKAGLLLRKVCAMK